MDLSRAWVAAVFVAVGGMAACGASHRKVSGPPPEYELPEDVDAAPSSLAPPADRPDASPPDARSTAPAAPTPRGARDGGAG